MNSQIQEYLGTTESVLDHYFANCITVVKVWHLDKGKTGDFEFYRRDFVSGLREAVSKNLPEHGNVTRQNLVDFIDFVEQQDLAKIETVKKIYRRYYQIKDEPFDEKKLFKD